MKKMKNLVTKFLVLTLAVILTVTVVPGKINAEDDDTKIEHFVINKEWENDLESQRPTSITIKIVGSDGSVTNMASKTLDYWVIKDGTVSMYEANKLSREADFAVKDKMVYINGVSTYRIDEMTRKEMTLSQDGFGILVSTYKYHYKKR